jgi:hypothetical protein
MLEISGEHKITPHENHPFHKTTMSVDDKGSSECILYVYAHAL